VNLEIWQANGAGRYTHPHDRNPTPLDPNFDGYANVVTDSQGRYRYRTVKPGAYPVVADYWRPPHIHYSIFGAGVMQRLITQAYFPGEELNDIDPILNGVEDLDARASLIARQVANEPDGALAFEFDIVLSGNGETPFFVDP